MDLGNGIESSRRNGWEKPEGMRRDDITFAYVLLTL
jgi:hypothetical protein